MKRSPIVSIIQRRLTDYRVPLFESMRGRLAAEGIELRLLYGVGTPEEARKDDSGELAWGTRLETHYLMRQRICYQPFLGYTRNSSLIVMPHENKQVANFLSMIRYRQHGPRLAFWGHGRNMQARNPNSQAERFKRWTLRRVDWWFAYTELSREFVVDAGFPPERITVLNNSIDTTGLRRQIEQATREMSLRQRRADFGLGMGPVGVYIGSLYPDKRLPFLIEAALRVRQRIPDFELVIAGDGDERPLVQAAARAHAGVTYVGKVKDERRARLLSCSTVALNPGLVGLAILDAFVAGLPVFTTDCGIHSPEIAYLDGGRNGAMTEDSLDAYADAVVAALQSPDRLEGLRLGARAAAEQFSIERMSERFCNGIVACVASGKLYAA